MPSYDVLEYHNLSSDPPLNVGDRFSLHEGEELEVVALAPPIHETKDATLIAKLHPAHPPWPTDWIKRLS